jgi:hypothetical protein
MRRRTSAVLTAAALLSGLTACSSSNAQPAARLGGGSPLPVSVESGGANAAVGAAAELPSDLTISYQFTMPTDPVKAALVNEAELIIQHYEIAVAGGSAAKLDINSVLSGPAGAQLYSLVRSDTANGTRPSGTIVFFRMTPALAANLGSVGICENDQQTTPVKISTDTSAGSAPTGALALRAWQFGFIKNSAGKYLLDYINIQAENRACI